MLGQAQKWRPTLAYGCAHFGKSLFWYSSEILFAFFLTEIAGLQAAQMGTVLAAGFLVSAAIDIVVGIKLQRWLTSPALTGRAQLVGAAASSTLLLAVFAGAWVQPEMRYGYALLAGIGFRFAFALYDIPQNVLMALATTDSVSRVRLASTRIWFSGAATLVVAGAVGPIVAAGNNSVTILMTLAASFSVVAVLTAAILVIVLSQPAEDRATVAMPRKSWRPEPEFWLLICASLITTIFTPAFAKLEPYFAIYVVDSAWWGGLVIILMAIGILIGQPFWLHLCARGTTAHVMMFAAVLQIVALVAFWTTGPYLPLAASFAAFVFGLGNGGVGMAQWAALSETVARGDPARAGVAYGMFLASNKIGLAAGGLLIAAMLDGASLRDAGDASLTTLMAFIPAIGAVLLVLNAAAFLAVRRPALSRKSVQ